MLKIFIGFCYVLVAGCLFFAAAAAFMGDWENFFQMLEAASKLGVSVMFLTIVSAR